MCMCITACACVLPYAYFPLCARMCLCMFKLMHGTSKRIWNTYEKYAYGPHTDTDTHTGCTYAISEKYAAEKYT